MKNKVSLSKFKRIIPYLKDDKKLFLGGLLSMIFVSGAQLLDPLILAHIIDNSVPAGDVQDMILWGGLFIIVIVISGVLSYFQTIMLARLGVKVITKLKYNVFEHMMKLPVSYFDKHPVGKLIARVESDGEKVKQLFSQFSVMILGNLMFFIGMLAIMFYKNWQVTMAIALPLPLLLAIVIIVVRYLARYYRKIRSLYADVSGVLAEYIQGVSIIQLFNRENTVERILDSKSRQKRGMETKAAFIEYSFWGILFFIVETMFIVIVILLTVPKIFAGIMTIGTLIVFIQYGRRIFEPLLQISETINMMQRAFVSLNRMFTILDMEPEEDEGAICKVDFNNSIEFRNVWFAYNKNEYVLKDVSFTVKKGEKIALVGASGSGKTTTISLLERFYSIDRGDILVDGRSIYDFDLKAWRSGMGLVLQDIYLFPGSVTENVRLYNDDIPVSKVKNALTAVQADIFINEDRKGMNAELLERGQNVSVGEKQLVSFARALVFNPDIIIMDEATASVDAMTEKKIQKAVEEMLRGKTAVIVAHRLSSVINADKILLFQDGKILAQGTHSEMMRTCKEYEKLVKLQFLSREDL
ncbi:MAG: ABC transporter ATP-binding protein [bacterium]